MKVGGVEPGFTFMLYVGYELAKEGLEVAIMGYPGLAHQLKGSFGCQILSLCGERFLWYLLREMVFVCTLGLIFTVMDFKTC